ncbi:hypothetical protein AN915_27655 [Mycobacteroides immunogenum]|uniref:Uncharacterized protein n=1 Tax=Mycobacteroides immunogenum TaxID=83262 RepID=A0ABR5LJV9_9MYCO|nr:hypothetical protein AN912_26285 [Mycobacteroides immunogenum]KPG26281.1 hypothetical protein AN913_21180 [Mycobacteroides immunogenum]KPG29727.1 hypothetical protein AN914_27265 [Mycobacteroides immunogenum]KPG38531.1 hypothetical protein AN915_27655 [Mycobacteroides immunogenum]KPG56171.1 hypothetical protein AN918_27870 [Mycobacteroides immunogenum]
MSTDTRLRTDTTSPPNPVFERGGLAVWVNGGYVEISCPAEFVRVTPSEASALMPALAAAVADAAAWAHRWDGTTRTYPA